MRLDQISALYALVDQAERGEVRPADGLPRLQAIREMRPRHGRSVGVVSDVAMTVGICLVLQPTPGDLAVSAFCGRSWACSSWQ